MPRPSRPLTPQRGWRWCLLTTDRDARRARRRGRPISRRNLERLFHRRWARVAPRCQPHVDRQRHAVWAQQGRELLRRGRELRRFMDVPVRAGAAGSA